MEDKRKMCWNCEGSISLEEEICPYCRASCIPSIEEDRVAVQASEVTKSQNDTVFLASTMALLMGGSFFFIFGCLLFFFSDSGYFILRWSDHYWYLYFLIAIPMIIFGARNLIGLPESPHERQAEEETLPISEIPLLDRDIKNKN